MTIKSDKWIRKMALEHGMIEPFVDRNVGKGEAVSYGLSSYGYDLRVADEFKIFHNALHTVIDPKNIDSNSFVDFKGDVLVIPTPSPWRVPWNISGFRKTSSPSASVNRPTLAAASSPM